MTGISRDNTGIPARSCRKTFFAAAVFAAVILIAVSITARPVYADDHKVRTVKKDTYVYCGGTYDFEVEPEKDAKGNPMYEVKSYEWKTKIETSPKTYHARSSLQGERRL